MAQLSACPVCSGFLPGAIDQCPHCQHALRTGLSTKTLLALGLRSTSVAKLLRGAVIFASSSSFALTLMACYGSPCIPGDDLDGDGFDNVCSFDCNDNDPTINPFALDDSVDGIDQNCDGVDGPIDEFIDAGPISETDAGEPCQNDADEDRDGFSTCGSDELLPDCDDTDSRVHPGAVDDSIDGVDQDCNGIDGNDASSDAGLIEDAGRNGDAGSLLTDGGLFDDDAGEGEADAGVPPNDAGWLVDDAGAEAADGG